MEDADAIKNIGGATGAAMWRQIDDLVKRWAKRNPYGANMNRLYNQEVRDGLFDKEFGTLNDNGMAGGRLTLSIHPELVNYIETFYPKFFASKENIRRFGNTYQMFKIPEKN